jgi:hypothetical protein
MRRSARLHGVEYHGLPANFPGSPSPEGKPFNSMQAQRMLTAALKEEVIIAQADVLRRSALESRTNARWRFSDASVLCLVVAARGLPKLMRACCDCQTRAVLSLLGCSDGTAASAARWLGGRE